MPEQKPKVSVIIPCYQNAKELPRSVNSVLAQDFSDFEIIILDNASTDATPQIISALSSRDPRIRIITLTENIGPAGARNTAAVNAHGNYLAFLDADDEWMNSKLATQVEVLDSYPDITMIFCDGYLVDEKLKIRKVISEVNKIQKRDLEFASIDPGKSIYHLNGPLRAELYQGNFINLSTVVIRKDSFNKLEGFNQQCYGMEDLDLWVRLANFYQIAYWFEKKVICYWRSDSLSRMTESRIRELLGYHLYCYSSNQFIDLRKISQQNLYNYYKLLILYFSKKWKPFQAIRAFFDSIKIKFFPSLLVYTILSFFGEIPIEIKTKIINPIFLRLFHNK